MSWNLDLTNVKDTTFELVPPGNYLVTAAEAEIKPTKNGTGEYISVKFLLREGPQEGRFIYHLFNIQNANPKATEIGLQQLRTFIKCAGKNNFNLTSVTDLCGLSAVAVVKHKTDDYGQKAVISYFKPAESDATTASVAQAKSGKQPF